MLDFPHPLFSCISKTLIGIFSIFSAPWKITAEIFYSKYRKKS